MEIIAGYIFGKKPLCKAKSILEYISLSPYNNKHKSTIYTVSVLTKLNLFKNSILTKKERIIRISREIMIIKKTINSITENKYL